MTDQSVSYWAPDAFLGGKVKLTQDLCIGSDSDGP